MHVLGHAVIDTLYLVPFLFVTYLTMEWLERKAEGKAASTVRRAGVAGPIAGAALGVVPQCGFSAAAATLYAGRVITLGTLFAVFLSTSDEMLPIFIAEQVDALAIAKVLGAKVVIGTIMGFVVDAALRITRRIAAPLRIRKLCEHDRCCCYHEEGGVFEGALRHTLNVALFIFLATFALDAVIEFAGEDALAVFLSSNPSIAVFLAALVGLVPNCAASVVIAQLYIDGALASGAMLAGSLVSTGVGLLVLLRTNHQWRQNLAIIVGLYVTGVCWGLIANTLGIVF